MQKFSARNTTRLVVATLILLTGLSLGSCSKRRQWKAEERKASNEMLRDWRHIAYLNALSETEFELFANRVTDALERKYPSFVEFIEMPMAGDSVEMVVIATIVSEIKASPDNMSNLFPYASLVKTEFLPAGMNSRQQSDFYRCFADKANSAFGSLQQFVWDAIYSQLDDYLIAHLIRQCATPFWDNVTTTVIIEED